MCHGEQILADREEDIIILEGHIRNSQTRAIQAILEKGQLKYKYVEVEDAKNVTADRPDASEDPRFNIAQLKTNNDGDSDKSPISTITNLSKEITPNRRNEEFVKKVIPIVMHKQFKILSTMPHLMTYFAHEFPDQMQQTGLYKVEHNKQI